MKKVLLLLFIVSQCFAVGDREFNSNVVPQITTTYDLGTLSLKWDEVHAVSYNGNGSALTGITGATGGISNAVTTSIIADNDGNGSGVIALQIGSPAVTMLEVTNAGNIAITNAITSGVWNGTAIDISDFTNLVAGTNITLSGDTLNVDDAFLVNDASDTMLGTLTSNGLTVTTGNALTFGVVRWDDLSDKIEGNVLADDSVDDDALDFTSITLADFTADIATTDLTDTANVMYLADFDTFAELQTQIADKTLLNEEDAATIDSAWIFNAGITGNLTGNVTGDLTGNADTAELLETTRTFSVSGDTTAPGVTFNGGGNVDLVTSIAAGVIVNTDVNGSAAIDADKLADGAVNAIVTLVQETNWDTHLTSDGSDHTFIDQSVISGSSPNFDNANMTGNVSVWTNDAGYVSATLTDEQVQDITGGMVSGNVETLIAVTYDDGAGKLDFVVDEANINHNALTNFDPSRHFLQSEITQTGTITSGTWQGTPIDISSFTNLAVVSPIVLTDDTLSLDETTIDHGTLSGLADNDHTQYVNAVTDSATIDFTLTGQSITGDVIPPPSDHGSLTGLADDDHEHYWVDTSLAQRSEDYTTTGTVTVGTLTDGTASMTAGHLADIDYIDFDLINGVAAAEGRLVWNDVDGTLNLGLKGGTVNLQIGQELVVRGKNTTGSQIDNGMAVRISGASGSNPEFGLSEADVPATAGSIGLATEDITNNQFGYVTTFGLVRDLDTSGTPVSETWNDADRLFVSNTAGELTNVPPTSNERKIFIGIVLRANATEGIILVSPINVSYLNELSGVQASPADNDLLQYDNASGIWENTKSLDGLTLNSPVIAGNVAWTGDSTATWSDNSKAITIIDNKADSLEILSAAAGWLTFDTTTIAPKIDFGGLALNPEYRFLGTGIVSVNELNLRCATQDYLFTCRAAALVLEGQDSSTNAFLEITTKDRDGSDLVGIGIYRQANAGFSTLDRLRMIGTRTGAGATDNAFKIFTDAISFTLAPLILQTGTNDNQLRLNTDNTIEMADDLTVHNDLFVDNDATIDNDLFVLGSSTLGDDAADLIDLVGIPTLKNGQELRFADTGDSNYVGFKAPALTANQIWTLPDADGVDGDVIFTDGSGNLKWGANASTRAFTFSSPSGGSGTTYAGGHYRFGSSDNDFNPGINFGTANGAYGDHIFLVAAAGASGGTDTVIRINGTKIDDSGNRVVGTNVDLTLDDAGAAGAYYETSEKWIGQVSITLLSGPDLLCNYGGAKYWDDNNEDFKVEGVDVTWLGGANDGGANLILRHHRPTGWTYNAGSTPTPPTPIDTMNTDYVTEINVINGEEGAWKRTNLLELVNGSADEGLIIEIITTANKTFEIGNFLIRVVPQ